MSMRCPACQCDEVAVTDSRPQANGSVVYRRRCCRSCQHRFSTREHIVDLERGAKGARALKALEEALDAARAEIQRLLRDE